MEEKIKISNSTVSSTIYSRAYLTKSWQSRDKLADYERYGFAQFFYLTISGHVEACMGELIEHRLQYVRMLVGELGKRKFVWPADNGGGVRRTEPLFVSLRAVLGHFARKSEKASIETLSEYYQDLFGVKLPDLLGDLHQDLKALAGLRNVFAHGRDLWFDFEDSDENFLILDRNPLQLPAQRLFHAKVVSTLQIDAYSHNEFRAAFFSDAALVYFLNCARRIEEILKSVLEYDPERDLPLMVSLPELT